MQPIPTQAFSAEGIKYGLYLTEIMHTSDFILKLFLKLKYVHNLGMRKQNSI